MNPEEIRELFERLKEATTKPKEEIERLCEKYLSETTSTHRLSIMGATIDPYNFFYYLIDKERGLPIIEQLAEKLTALLHERGYRNNVETYQEHRLCGSSGSGCNPNAEEFPYTVGAILNGKITIEEARRARELGYLCGNAYSGHWGFDDGEIYCIILPEIDDNGLSVRDPVLVDSTGRILAEKLVDGAPYKRS